MCVSVCVWRERESKTKRERVQSVRTYPDPQFLVYLYPAQLRSMREKTQNMVTKYGSYTINFKKTMDHRWKELRKMTKNLKLAWILFYKKQQMLS